MPHVRPPTSDELPAPRTLVRAALLALVAAAALAVTVVLPAEYGIDPTGVGSAVGLTLMGEMKAAALRADAAEATQMRRAADLLAAAPADFGRADTIRVALGPGEGREVKLVMRRGARATFAWSTDRGVVGYDLHGDALGESDAVRSYRSGAGAWSDQGTLEAAFDGRHGWFWQNQSDAPLFVTLRTRGAYLDVQGAD